MKSAIIRSLGCLVGFASAIISGVAHAVCDYGTYNDVISYERCGSNTNMDACCKYQLDPSGQYGPTGVEITSPCNGMINNTGYCCTTSGGLTNAQCVTLFGSGFQTGGWTRWATPTYAFKGCVNGGYVPSATEYTGSRTCTGVSGTCANLSDMTGWCNKCSGLYFDAVGNSFTTTSWASGAYPVTTFGTGITGCRATVSDTITDDKGTFTVSNSGWCYYTP